MKKIMKIPNNNIQYAGFAIRLKAFAYDYLLILTYIIILAGVNFWFILQGRTIESISPLLASPITKDVIAFLTLILPVILYFTIQESSVHQGIWGKKRQAFAWSMRMVAH